MNDFYEENMRKRSAQLVEENERLKRVIKAHEAVWRFVHDKATTNKTLKAIASERSEGKIPDRYLNVKT